MVGKVLEINITKINKWYYIPIRGKNTNIKSPSEDVIIKVKNCKCLAYYERKQLHVLNSNQTFHVERIEEMQFSQ